MNIVPRTEWTYRTVRHLGIVIPIIIIRIDGEKYQWECHPCLTHWGARRVAERELQWAIRMWKLATDGV